MRPIGWHTRCPHSANTRRLLVEEGGFLYDSDAYDDDLPCIVDCRRPRACRAALQPGHQRHALQRPEGASSGPATSPNYCNDAFDWLWKEGETAPKMMTIGLHTRIIGRPGRIAGLDVCCGT